MTWDPVSSTRNRRQHIATLREMAVNFTAVAEGHGEENEMAQAELWQQRAAAVCWALMGYVQQHINLETGQIRAVPEPEQAA